jgi:hypothetical protein
MKTRAWLLQQIYNCKSGSGFALDGNPEPDLEHATGCKQPTLRTVSQIKMDSFLKPTDQY